MSTDILRETPDRLLLLPVRDEKAWSFYKDAIAAFWTAEEIDLAHDDFGSLHGNDRRALKAVLAFFAAADGIVGENLATNMIPQVQSAEARAFYAAQCMIETIHAEVYGQLILSYVPDPSERAEMFTAVQSNPAVKRLADWSLRWTDDRRATFGERLVAFACVEGILFSGPFCVIFYYKTRGLLPGLCKANEFIARDEAQHMMFACFLFKERLLEHQRPEDARVHEIVRECVELEKQFIEHAIAGMPGLTRETMDRYIEFVADVLCVSMGVARIYNTPNPYSWMTMIGIPGKTNFFEGRVSDYKRSRASEITDNRAFSGAVDF